MQRILIVEDNPTLRALYAREFSADGYETIVLDGTGDTLARVFEWAPDAIILDTMTPGLEVDNFIHAVRSKLHSIPIILNSNFPRRMDAAKHMTINTHVMNSGNIDDLKQSLYRSLAVDALPHD